MNDQRSTETEATAEQTAATETEAEAAAETASTPAEEETPPRRRRRTKPKPKPEQEEPQVFGYKIKGIVNPRSLVPPEYSEEPILTRIQLTPIGNVDTDLWNGIFNATLSTEGANLRGVVFSETDEQLHLEMDVPTLEAEAKTLTSCVNRANATYTEQKNAADLEDQQRKTVTAEYRKRAAAIEF